MRYLRITGPDINNGEGCRITLWLPGCTHKCKGCHNEWTHNYNQGADFTEDTYIELLEKLTPSYISGLTISGGDPLCQSNAVLIDILNLIKRIRQDVPGKNIWLYTGFKYENLVGLQRAVAQLCDVIVDGPYIEELRDVSLPFRGSSNQRIINIQQPTKEEVENKYIITEQNKNNMRKNIFKGFINGQEFDNINDYNNRINELLSTGQNINASTSTQIVDDCKETSPAPDLFPVFEDTKYETPCEYLDDVITDDSEANAEMIANLKQYLTTNHNMIVEKLAGMNCQEREEYGNGLIKILDSLNNIYEGNKAAITDIESKYEVLFTGSQVLDLLITEYSDLIYILCTHKCKCKSGDTDTHKCKCKSGDTDTHKCNCQSGDTDTHKCNCQSGDTDTHDTLTKTIRRLLGMQ